VQSRIFALLAWTAYIQHLARHRCSLVHQVWYVIITYIRFNLQPFAICCWRILLQYVPRQWKSRSHWLQLCQADEWRCDRRRCFWVYYSWAVCSDALSETVLLSIGTRNKRLQWRPLVYRTDCSRNAVWRVVLLPFFIQLPNQFYQHLAGITSHAGCHWCIFFVNTQPEASSDRIETA
jgi:hypothetical protein